uniref:Protein kinase domain-containing protein n=1 Tax=Euplotes crassus TaxID=5936 RepID=A0A7S3NT45_EUPCR|mmetsp:Transcript_18752/g.18418  ORF Transcript_18752/g.18418 Transcript_18752/m.18418 type:complete len:176 (+) Transcript_18752:427-954(+)
MDIKLENILLDCFFNVKLADLGTVVDVSESEGYTNQRRGTPHYMAPEVLNKKPAEMIDGRLSDIYSLGVCLHLMLTGEFPDLKDFSDEFSIETESSGEIINHKKYDKGTIQFLSRSAKDLLSEMLQEDASYRISLEDIASHPWLSDCDFSDMQELVYLEMKARSDHINNTNNEDF